MAILKRFYPNKSNITLSGNKIRIFKSLGFVDISELLKTRYF